ncbi:MAG: sulfotransferase [Myxococcales bacterium]|nr:MAG: sulfotransferase [Myxococcales bacterium]
MNDNAGKVFFVIGSPRSGSTLLARMLGSHSQILTRGEPNMLTPLAHLGYYAKVDKAPYDAILAAESIREFVAELPGGEQDYIDACRAYTDTLYLRYLAAHPGEALFLDKTPAYALILDFMARIYPSAKYIVLTRHPLVIFSSYAESFFDSDYQAAHDYNPIAERYVPAIAKFLRDAKTLRYHVVYEKLVADPAPVLAEIFDFLGVPNEPEAVNYGKHEYEGKGLGDPIGVGQHSRPTTASIHKWATEIAADPARMELCRGIIERLAPEDLELWGYPVETIWQPLEEAGFSGARPKPKKLDRYRLQRKAIVRLRKLVGRSGALRKLLERVRLGADVLLRS